MKDVSMSNLKIQERKKRNLGVSRNCRDDCFWVHPNDEKWITDGKPNGFGRLSKQHLREVEDALIKVYPGQTRETLSSHIEALVQGTFVCCHGDETVRWLFTYGISFAHLTKDKGIDAFYGRNQCSAFHFDVTQENMYWWYEIHGKTAPRSYRIYYFERFRRKFPLAKCIEVRRSDFRWLHDDVFPFIQRYWWHRAIDRWRCARRRVKLRLEEEARRRKEKGLAQILHLPLEKKSSDIN